MIKAQVGDWLVVHARTDSGTERRGKIVAVHGPTGEPPFDVHWLDTDHTTLVYPGPDAQVFNASDLEAIDKREQARIGAVQSEILASEPGATRASSDPVG